MASLTLDQAWQLACAQQQAGRLEEAESLARQLLERVPGHGEVLNLLGVLAQQRGEFAQAEGWLRKALASAPENTVYLCNLGEVQRTMGQLKEAAASLQRALELQPDFFQAWFHLGNVLVAQGERESAGGAYERALAGNPQYAEAWNNLGTIRYEQHRKDEAIMAYQQAVALRGDYAEGLVNLGNACQDVGRLDEAIEAYHAALALNPGAAAIENNLGNALKAQGRLEDAASSYKRALAACPELAEAHSNLGTVRIEQGRLEEALVHCQRAFELKPTGHGFQNNLGNIWKAQARLDEALACYRAALEIEPNEPSFHDNVIYTLHHHPASTPAELLAEARRWNERHGAVWREARSPLTNGAEPGRRLKIGYVSPDLGNHPVGLFLLPLLQRHDRVNFECICYSDLPHPTAFTALLRAAADGWRETCGWAEERLAATIREDEIDVLVDLALHTAGNRLEVFARRPAPVQVTWLAYCSTSGLETMDYRLSDPHFDPPGTDETVYSEMTLRLPETYWCYQPAPEANLPVTPLPALTAGYVTFGCLNNFCKVSAPTLALWGRLLKALPSAKLRLSAPQGSRRETVHAGFRAAGVDPARVIFVDRCSLPEYLAEQGRCDIALDPFPYGGGTTTCDALWMGTPVITLTGQTAVGRGGTSILSNLGLPELIAHTEEEYLQIAVALAQDLPRLAAVRTGLRARLQASPLMDAPRFAKNMEAAYRTMWQHWCAQQTRITPSQGKISPTRNPKT